MTPSPPRRSALRLTVGLFAAGCLVWGMARFGGTRGSTIHALFLLLLPAVLAAAATFDLTPFRNKRLLLLTAVGVYLALQVALRPTLAATGYVVASLGWMALFLTLWLTATEWRATRAVVWFLLAVGAFESCYGLVQALGGVDSIFGYAREKGALATGTLIHQNHFAGLLNMILALALGTVFGSGGRTPATGSSFEQHARTWLQLLGVSFFAVAVFLSRSRGGVLTLVVTLLFLSSMLALLGWRRRERSLPVLAGVGVFVMLVLGVSLSADALGERFRTPLAGERLVYYGDTLRMIADHPLAGVGPGMYRWRIRPYQSLEGEMYGHAHNDYLETAAEWGVPLALLLWSFVVWRFYRSVRVFLTSRDRWRQGLALGCSGAMLSILLHSLVDFNLQVPTNLMIFCTIVGLSWRLDEQRRSRGSRRRARASA